MSIDVVCTIGPASRSPELLRALLDRGMTVARLNMSHGDQASHRDTIRTLRSISEETGKSIRILGDVQGPKIRLGPIEGDAVRLEKGQRFTLHCKPIAGGTAEAGVDYEGITNDVKPGASILINDGEVRLVVKTVMPDRLETEVLVGGRIGSHKGVNLPGTRVGLPVMTDKDRSDIRFLAEEKVDMIACSFIREAVHLKEIRNFVASGGQAVPRLIAKIETMAAVEQFPSILAASDGVMVARGDLGVELPFEWIPVIQKAIIGECRRSGAYVITATQMLQSMTERPIPTRAEVTDVFQAVLDGTDAVMLSAESAVGKYPLESAGTMRLVADFAESARDLGTGSFSDVVTFLQRQQQATREAATVGTFS